MSVEGPESGPRSNNPYQQLLGDMRKQRRLFSVHWELTYRCNERCTHCYLDVLKPNARCAGRAEHRAMSAASSTSWRSWG